MPPHRPTPPRLRTAALSLATAAFAGITLSAAAQAEDSYIWISQSLPPLGTVGALDFPEHPLCRITLDQPGHPDHDTQWLGWFDGTDCRVETVSTEAHSEREFLMPAPGHFPYWIPLPAGDLTTAPPEALLGGRRHGEDLVICSQDGVTGSIRWATASAGGTADLTRCAATPPWEEETAGQIYVLTDIIIPVSEEVRPISE
ncbi:hypothetical protein [Maricaulis sp.]|uniref:hypothetical protein n=1 Tax=Maricaulis sp. TaxID=1486257 RepID=UPI003A8F9EB1